MLCASKSTMADYTYKLPALNYTINRIGDIQEVDQLVECASRRHSARTVAITDTTLSKDKNGISKSYHNPNSYLNLLTRSICLSTLHQRLHHLLFPHSTMEHQEYQCIA